MIEKSKVYNWSDPLPTAEEIAYELSLMARYASEVPMVNTYINIGGIVMPYGYYRELSFDEWKEQEGIK